MKKILLVFSLLLFCFPFCMWLQIYPCKQVFLGPLLSYFKSFDRLLHFLAKW
jgi:hypothetical protein